ncbi:8847_t:CDS:10 [Acaulospora morrowiae]|uniref:8847_t:CDS:1 n=1 Tax=Acaulospora morrowiae TaxID=94023 RepID=A0A9N8ZAU5_9GLOM|nr:8847_t:CDS:10 [Acaulospora morrowiae]
MQIRDNLGPLGQNNNSEDQGELLQLTVDSTQGNSSISPVASDPSDHHPSLPDNPHVSPSQESTIYQQIPSQIVNIDAPSHSSSDKLLADLTREDETLNSQKQIALENNPYSDENGSSYKYENFSEATSNPSQLSSDLDIFAEDDVSERHHMNANNFSEEIEDKEDNSEQFLDDFLEVPKVVTIDSREIISNKGRCDENKSGFERSKNDPKRHIAAAILDHRSKLITPDTSFKYGEDLAEYIPGFYRLLDLRKDDGSNGLVDKIIISKDSLKKLCNDMIPYSFSSISEIDYNRLNALSFRLIGCYGNHLMIAKLLLNKNVINEQLFDLLTSAEKTYENRNKSNLRPGIYLSIVNRDVGLVIHWPEQGCYEENAPSQRKKNMINLHRYLTKLTDEQLCLMSDKDLEYFEYFEFEVKKSQEEQEDFKLAKGFEVSLPHDANENAIENKNRTQLSPMIVESVHHQAYITRSIITSSVSMTKYTSHYHGPLHFKNDLGNKLKGRSLKIYRTMDIKGLKLLVKNGLGLENELLGPLDSAIEKAKMLIDSKQELEMKNIKKDAELVGEIARKMLQKYYPEFEEKLKANDSSSSLEVDELLKQLDEKYQGISIKINNAMHISSESWKKLKIRYFLTALIIKKVFSSKKNENLKEFKGPALEAFYGMLVDKEDDPHSLVKKYTEKATQSGFFGYLFQFVKDTIKWDYSEVNLLYNNAITYANGKEDHEFIKTIRQTSSFDASNDIRQKIIDEFFEEYQKWRKNMFDSNVKRIAPKYSDKITELKKKYDEEFLMESRKIEEQEFERICLEIEKRFATGRIFRIIDVTEGVYSSGFRVTYELETTKPDQLRITIYETSWDQSDNFRLQEDEYHVPKPTLSDSRGNAGISFYVDPEIYDFRKIARFEDEKYFVILWNKKENKTEIFFDKAPKLATSIQPCSKKCLITLRTEEFCLFAVNESKGLLGIFNTETGVLDVFAFDEERKNIFHRNNKVQILQWYNNVVPDIQHFFFIKDTEEICFVEVGGRARLYNLVNGQFRPSEGKIPENASTVLSTPDGACIVAFVRESMREVDHHTLSDSIDNDLSSDADGDSIPEKSVKEIEVCRAHVYFCSNFGQPASKIIELPSDLNLECLQFSQLCKRQMHLMSLDLEKRMFHSLIVKITIEKTQYRFQQRSQRKPLGQVKLASPTRNKDYSIIQGNRTHFERDVDVGENIILLGERYRVVEILSDTMLKISGSFRPGSGYEWVDFRIEPKTKLNGYIDAYKLMFEKYPIDGCIDSEQTKPLSLRVLLDVSDDDEIDDYQDKFEEYINDMFEEVKRTTRKPASMLKKFVTAVELFRNFDIEDFKSLRKNSSEFQFGEWIIQLSCLIPIQIAVARNNQFHPLHDGLSSTELDHFDGSEDYGHHAKLCIIIKDVPPNDKEDIVREFTLRFNSLVAEEGEDNFISKMYPSGLTILPWALFSDPGWYEHIYVLYLYRNLKDVKKMLDKQEARYENARTFLQNIKVIMAKLRICDWSSLDENLVQIRISMLRRVLQTAVSLGIEQKEPVKEPLMNRDTGLEIEDITPKISEIFEGYNGSATLPADSDMLLFEENPDFLRLSRDLRAYFEEHIQSREDVTEDSEWFAILERYFKYIIERRIFRVQEWFSQNTIKFPQDNSDVVIGGYALEQEIGKLSLFWTLCGLTCHECNLKCLKNRDHADGQHDCLTDHECHASCQFSDAHKDSIPQCSHKAAHSGKHACDKVSHLCGQNCSLYDKRNCQKKCSKEIGHEDGVHLCQSLRHYCGATCSLSTYTQKGHYQCPNKCIIPCEDDHEIHRCENEMCPIPCPIPECQRRCQSDDHFHSLSDLHVDHFCGNEHQCQEQCEHSGVCKVLTEPKKNEQKYQGLSGTSFTFIKYTQVSEKLKCNKKIPSNSFKHEGLHCHNEDGVHFCDAQSYCELKLFHASLDPSLLPPNGCGYVSLDGHQFNCENPATREAAFHIIFVLDRSGSMFDTDKRPLQNTPIYNNLVLTHNNRLGAVYNAVYSFLDTRISSFRSSAHNSAATPRDSVSLILFDHEASLEIENLPLDDPDQFLNVMLKYSARGGTNFDLAIQKAGFVIDRHFDPTKCPVIIFCSDGECGIPEHRLRQICLKNQQRGLPIYLYTVLFSSTLYSPSLEKMAEIAKSYHPKSSTSGALKCQFTRAIDEVSLINHFTGVAESLREHKPALLKKNSI